jgi:hypothetical protein
VTESERLERVRTLCTALPEVGERLNHGEATWLDRGKNMSVVFCDAHLTMPPRTPAARLG